MKSKRKQTHHRKTSQKKRRLQGIVIDGITYTCAACRAGHRVGVCKHAKERPMRATHPPGRPASGATKKIVCDCPKNCSCARKGCRCPRNCSCTQDMYLLVYVPGAQEPDDSQTDEDSGSWKLGKQVTTDLKGNLLTAEEVEKRQQQKLAQRAEKESTKTFPVTPAVPEAQILLQSSTLKAEPKHCCKASQPPEALPQNTAPLSQPVIAPPRPVSTQGCLCGTNCSCAFCPAHPNNHTSQNLARKQALLFSQQQQQQSDSEQYMHMLQNFRTPQINSCMGQQPMFAMSHLPMKPTPASFQQAFPLAAPGYMLAYPMRGHFGRSMPQTPLGPPVEVYNMQTAQSAPSLQESSIVDSDLGFEDMCFDIGDAWVASDGPEGWRQLSNEHEASFNFASMSSPSTFDPASWNMNVDMSTPSSLHSSLPSTLSSNVPPSMSISLDLSLPPILPQIEPNFLDPTPGLNNASVSSPTCQSCLHQPPAPTVQMRAVNDMTMSQLYVSPGVYLSPSAQIGSPHGTLDDSWRLQAL